VKILVVRLSSIGDVVLATPLMRCLRKKYPAAQIDFLVREQYSSILSQNPNISNLILFKDNVFELARWIRKEKYDFVLDIHNNLRTCLMTFFSGAKIFRYKNNSFLRFLLVEFGINLYREKLPVFKWYLKTAEPLGVVYDNEGMDLFIDNKIKDLLSQNLKNGSIGICPVSVWGTKRWPKEYFVEFSKTASQKNNCDVLIFGGKNDFDFCEDIKKQVGEKAKNLCGLSLQETAAALKKCRYVLSNDTGLMHMAEALKVPVVAVFGPTVEEFGFYPQTENSKVLSKKYNCKPCSTKGSEKCPVGDFKCMRDISVQEATANCAAYI